MINLYEQRFKSFRIYWFLFFFLDFTHGRLIHETEKKVSSSVKSIPGYQIFCCAAMSLTCRYNQNVHFMKEKNLKVQMSSRNTIKLNKYP